MNWCVTELSREFFIISQIVSYFLLMVASFSDINDIIMIYVSPEPSTVHDVQNTNGIDILNGKIFDITSAYPHAKILLAGDLNARVRDFCDLIPEDTLDNIFGENIAYSADNFNIPRKSKDCNFYNNFGLAIIELCCRYSIHILNCRLFKDQHGEFTCFANNGRSVVDFVIAPTKLFPLFTDFGVSNYLLFVHCPVYCTLKLKMKQMQQITSEENNLTYWSKIKWNESLKDHFLLNFESCLLLFKKILKAVSDIIQQVILCPTF